MEEELQNMTDQQLVEEGKKLKSFTIMNALLIGFLIGVVLYSLLAHSFGFLMVIPLYMIYRFSIDPRAKRSRAVSQLLKERNLKL